MTASVDFLAGLVTVAAIVGTLSPLILIGLWVRDARRGQLW